MADLNKDTLAVALAKAKKLAPDAKLDSIVRSNYIFVFFKAHGEIRRFVMCQRKQMLRRWLPMLILGGGWTLYSITLELCMPMLVTPVLE